MSKNNGLFYDEANENHSLKANLESVKILDAKTQTVELVFTKGTDTVKQFIQSNTLFEAIAEYYENSIHTDAKTGFVYKGYYASGVVL
jgi:hypothetical protein